MEGFLKEVSKGQIVKRKKEPRPGWKSSGGTGMHRQVMEQVCPGRETQVISGVTCGNEQSSCEAHSMESGPGRKAVRDTSERFPTSCLPRGPQTGPSLAPSPPTSNVSYLGSLQIHKSSLSNPRDPSTTRRR